MPDILPAEQLLTMLAGTPARLAAIIAGATPIQLRTAPGPDEWSANDVLAHLRACSDMWGKAIATILEEDRPAFRAVSPRTWIHRTDYPDLEFEPSLQAFNEQRAGLMEVLNALDAAAWARGANVTGAGRPLHPTVQSYAERLAIHERPHVKQIERAVASVTR